VSGGGEGSAVLLDRSGEQPESPPLSVTHSKPNSSPYFTSLEEIKIA
jgi:hypothetical protein